MSSITNITKKKTAIIIPNAVGIVTEDHKVGVDQSLDLLLSLLTCFVLPGNDYYFCIIIAQASES